MRERVLNLKAKLEELDSDAWVVVRHHRYLSCTAAGELVIIPLEEEPILVCTRLELERASAESRIKDVRPYSSLDHPGGMWGGRLWEVTGRILNEVDARKVVYDEMSPIFLKKLKRRTPQTTYRRFPKFFSEFCEVKTEEELKWLRRAAGIAAEGMKCAAQLIRKGITELEIAAEIEYEMRRKGSEGTPFHTIVASGRNAAIPHATASNKVLKEGELVIVDLGATCRGYASDMTRTFTISPTPKLLKLKGVVEEAQKAALNVVKSGIEGGRVDAEARRVISEKGLSDSFIHGTGHGIGLEVHEPPSLSPNSKKILRENVVITVEPGVYVPKLGGARKEDMVVVKRGGYVRLTPS